MRTRTCMCVRSCKDTYYVQRMPMDCGLTPVATGQAAVIIRNSHCGENGANVPENPPREESVVGTWSILIFETILIPCDHTF